jgi:peptidylprolyl isomerase
MTKTALLLTGLLALTLAAVACGGDDGDSSGPPELSGDLVSYTTPGGVTVIEIAYGSAKDPVQDGDRVQMNYTGWLTDGTQFDSSYDRGEPFTFTLGAGDVIQGWDEGVQGMSPSDQRRLIIPPELGYGSQGSGAIPPNAELIFDIEMVAFGRPPTPGPTFPVPTIEEGETSYRTEGGVLVTVVKTAAEDDPAQPGDTVEVHYTGWLEDGTQFDSSLQRDPITLELGAGDVIQGWDEGLEGMSPGEVRQLVIPPELAYGDQARGEIPANATLIFEVELVSVTHPSGE